MPADRIHLIRHGEVHNPEKVIYGRLPHFRLSDRGRLMAKAASDELLRQKRKVTGLVNSPLLRTRESAEPVAEAYGLDAKTDDRLIEPWNRFEGRRVGVAELALRPHLWVQLWNPMRPSWGEPFKQIAARMLAAMDDAYKSVPDGDVVLVSHQLPIEMVVRTLAGKSLPHDPRKRRTKLSSITSFERRGGNWVEVDYKDPGAKLNPIDAGAV